MSRAYAINEVFATLQGEGRLAGTPAIFVRFSGCNLWTGRAEHRERDAERHHASCPRWCDTDFAEGERRSAAEIASLAALAAETAAEVGMNEVPLVVFTGGEPLLQLDPELVEAVVAALPSQGRRPIVAIETNGTVAISDELRPAITWTCVSPKTAPEQIRLRNGDELKVVYPGGVCEPRAYADALGTFHHYLISPLAEPLAGTVGQSLLSKANMDAAVRYCLQNPTWRLSVQTHKVIGVR